MDYEKAKLRSDVDGLTGLIQSLIVRAEVLEKHTEVGVLAQQVRELQARVDGLEQAAKAEADAKAAADAKAKAEADAKAAADAKAKAEADAKAKAEADAKAAADAEAAKAAKRLFNLKTK